MGIIGFLIFLLAVWLIWDCCVLEFSVKRGNFWIKETTKLIFQRESFVDCPDFQPHHARIYLKILQMLIVSDFNVCRALRRFLKKFCGLYTSASLRKIGKFSPIGTWITKIVKMNFFHENQMTKISRRKPNMTRGTLQKITMLLTSPFSPFKS